MSVRELIGAMGLTLRDGQICECGRALAETYDTMMEVERNPTGAWQAIQQMDAAMDKARRDLSAALRALEAEGR